MKIVVWTVVSIYLSVLVMADGDEDGMGYQIATIVDANTINQHAKDLGLDEKGTELLHLLFKNDTTLQVATNFGGSGGCHIFLGNKEANASVLAFTRKEAGGKFLNKETKAWYDVHTSLKIIGSETITETGATFEVGIILEEKQAVVHRHCKDFGFSIHFKR